MAPRGIRRTIAAGAALLAAATSLASASGAHAATTITVPAMEPTIQAAINAASNGDTVLVSPGTYTENIDFHGKAITVEGSSPTAPSIIDGGGVGPVANFSSGETTASVLRGFTLRHGVTTSANAYMGGGVRISLASPSIISNVITGNTGCSGIGVSIASGAPLVQGNTISNNIQTGCSGGVGAGMFVRDASSAEIVGNTITGNTADSGGGIELFSAGTATVQDNLIENNTGTTEGGGLDIVNQSDVNLVQNIVASNTSTGGAGMYVTVPSGTRGPWLTNDTIAANNGIGLFVSGFDSNMVVANTLLVAPAGDVAAQCDTSYNAGAPAFVTTDAYNGGGAATQGPCFTAAGSTGDISVDPQFRNASSGDYHLTSASPAVNAGTNSAANLPSADFDGNPRVVGGTVDLGVYEVQPPATTPGPVTNLAAVRNRSTITVSWSPPASNGGSAITGYRVTESPGASQTVGAGVLSVTYVNTSRHTTYTFTVVAINAVGAGPASSVTAPRS